MKALIITITLLFLLSACAYRNIFNPAEIEDAIDTLLVIRTEAVIEGKENFIMRATAFSIGDYVIALTHATKAPAIMRMRTPFGFMFLPQKVLSEKHFIGDEEIKLIGRHRDISLFKSDKKCFPFKFGDSDKVRIGTKVVVLGRSFGKSVNVKNGIISRVNIKKSIYGEEADVCFLSTTPANPGDSGSPMLAYRNGRWEVIGIVNAVIRDKGMSFALKSSFIKVAISKITS